MTSFLSLFLILIIVQLLLYKVHSCEGSVDPSNGFISLPFNRSYYHIQKPYDLPEDQRYKFVDGVHYLWVFSTDKPHSRSSKTEPRTEIGIQGYNYSLGIWQFEGDFYVPLGTSGVCVMQVFGAAPPHATTLMLRVFNGSLMYYNNTVLISNIYDKWFHLNVVHDVEAAKVKVFVDGCQMIVGEGRGGTSHTFKCGVYAQRDDSYYMESRWKNIKILKS